MPTLITYPTHLDLWSMLLLFGALQGLFFAFTLLRMERGNRAANRLLACLLFALSLQLGEYVLVASGYYRHAPHWLGVTLPCVFLIGPLYFLYGSAVLQERFRLVRKHALHFIPALLCMLVLFRFYLQPAAAKVEFVAGLVQRGYVIFPLDQFLLMALSTFQMLAYFYLTYARLQGFAARFKAESANAEILNLEWLQTASIAFSLYMMLFFVAYFQLFLLQAHRQEIFYLAMLVLSGFIHAVGYHGLRFPEIFSSAPMPTRTIKYQKNPLPEGRAQSYVEKLHEYMTTAQPYLKPELKLSEVAEALRMPANHLSQVLNAELGKNFFDFINEQRIAAAQQRLLDPHHAHYTILAIALEVGFNNKASFNRVFKKLVGMTPSEYVNVNKAGSMRSADSHEQSAP